MDNARKIKVASHRLKLVCTGLIFILPLLWAVFGIFFSQLNLINRFAGIEVPPDLIVATLPRVLAFAISMLPLSAMLFGLVNLKRLFALYEKGYIFTAGNVACFRRMGQSLLLWVVLSLAGRSLTSLALTFQNPPGQRVLCFSLNSNDFIGLLVGFSILTVAWVMNEACKMQDDLQLIV